LNLRNANLAGRQSFKIAYRKPSGFEGSAEYRTNR
jgi:hypothetical protein